MSTSRVTFPPSLQYWTADECAECLPGMSDALYAKLWQISTDAHNEGGATPSGGDGTDGTVETPDERLGDFSDQGPRFWVRLTEDEQRELAVCSALQDAEDDLR